MADQDVTQWLPLDEVAKRTGCDISEVLKAGHGLIFIRAPKPDVNIYAWPSNALNEKEEGWPELSLASPFDLAGLVKRNTLLVDVAGRTMLISHDNLWVKADDIGRFDSVLGVKEGNQASSRPWAHMPDNRCDKESKDYKREADRIKESLTPEQRRIWAREATARNAGNKTKAGLELNLSDTRIRQLLNPKA